MEDNIKQNEEVLQENVPEEALPPEPTKKYATFDADGRPIAFFSSDIHDTIPEGAIFITDEAWLELSSYSDRRKIIKGKIVECDPAQQPVTWEMVRQMQKRLLSETDYIMLIDSDFTDEQRLPWIEYRKQVRLVNNTYSKPEDVIWPKKPK